ncbi:hypothetical protein [Salisediminibacterium halotolerans]|uniref:Uncharacterized protein n=1 Tax=Salisediminibacterium halotolerans TaxID=517425 RepID=A0A1H9NX42_9BACI|nr:hypothetical protein [Salisediminibacterium haloalkalitolerans]SER40614.1 hypothetical protein SAMN05444126_10110 [Salisediminibacterium haloalkalitolerans]
MSWRERLWEQKWLHPLLPSYLKPLDEPAIMNEFTKEFVYEAEEFISDLAALTELPRMNKTFKRSLQGYSYKIKIKPKKIHVEMFDTNKSSSSVKKRVFLTTYRKTVKSEHGSGKILESVIYYQLNNKTHVRNVRKHPYFQSLFHHIHRLDASLNGEHVPELTQSASSADAANNERQLNPSESESNQAESILASAKHTYNNFAHLSETAEIILTGIMHELERCLEEFALLDIEEKHHIKRMIQHDLPNLLHTYRTLSPEQKQKTYDNMLRNMSNMRGFLKQQADDLQGTRIDRMNQLIQLNDLRYSEPRRDPKKQLFDSHEV